MPAVSLRPPSWAGRLVGGGRLWALAALTIATVWLGFLGARFGGGVAGTDQYWYAGDLRMSAATGRAVSNHVYPLYAASVRAGTLPPRMHDAPVTHVASWAHGVLGAAPGADGWAWTIVNMTLAVATTAAVVATSRALGGAGGWGAVAFVVYPTTVWAAVSPLAESSLAFGVAVLVGATVAAERTGRGAWWVVAGAAGGLLVWGRTNFVLLLGAWVGWLAWSTWRARKDERAGRTAGWRVAGVATAAGVVVGHAVLTASYPNAGLAATLMVGAAGRSSNMDFYFVPVTFDLGRFLDKAAAGAWRALTPRTPGELTSVLPVVLACALGAAARARMPRDRAWTAAMFLAMASLLTYLVTCAVFQPQTRYLYATAPLAAVLLDVAATRAWSSGRRRLVVRSAVALVAVVVVAAGSVRSFNAAMTVHTAGRRAAVSTARMEAALAPVVGEQGSVLVLAPGNATDLAVAYAAIPHPTISVDPALIPPAQARELATAWHVTAVVARPRDADYVAQMTGSATGRTPRPVASGFAIWPLPAAGR